MVRWNCTQATLPREGSPVHPCFQLATLLSEVGNRVVVEPGVKIIGVKIASRRYVPTGAAAKQADADALPKIMADYTLRLLP